MIPLISLTWSPSPLLRFFVKISKFGLKCSPMFVSTSVGILSYGINSPTVELMPL